MRSSFFKNPSGEFFEGRCIRIDIAQKVGGYSAMVQGATIEFLDYIKSSVLHPAFELKSCSRMKHEEAMEHLRSLGMAQMSARYAALRDGIVQGRMNVLRGFTHDAVFSQTLSRPNDLLVSPGLPYQEARVELLGVE
jgi:hypothetical protein